MHSKRAIDPSIADFVKALARANAARDIARLKGARGHEELQRKKLARAG